MDTHDIRLCCEAQHLEMRLLQGAYTGPWSSGERRRKVLDRAKRRADRRAEESMRRHYERQPIERTCHCGECSRGHTHDDDCAVHALPAATLDDCNCTVSCVG